jgi:hypothetical protein
MGLMDALGIERRALRLESPGHHIFPGGFSEMYVGYSPTDFQREPGSPTAVTAHPPKEISTRSSEETLGTPEYHVKTRALTHAYVAKRLAELAARGTGS